jgi:hypothetical protein
MFYFEQHNINCPEVGCIFQLPDMFKQPENNIKIELRSVRNDLIFCMLCMKCQLNNSCKLLIMLVVTLHFNQLVAITPVACTKTTGDQHYPGTPKTHSKGSKIFLKTSIICSLCLKRTTSLICSLRTLKPTK